MNTKQLYDLARSEMQDLTRWYYSKEKVWVWASVDVSRELDYRRKETSVPDIGKNL